MAAQNSQGDAGKSCLELQDALSKQLPPDIHHQLLPASKTIALGRTSKTMRAAEKADAIVQARGGISSPQTVEGFWTS
jgi:hypothetical protein